MALCAELEVGQNVPQSLMFSAMRSIVSLSVKCGLKFDLNCYTVLG